MKYFQRRRCSLIPLELNALLKKQAILDIIVVPEQDAWRRLVSYHRNKETHTEFFKLDPGTGDHLSVLFSKEGTILKGFDHEIFRALTSSKSAHLSKQLYRNLPDVLRSLSKEDPQKNEVTFCFWKTENDTQWHENPFPASLAVEPQEDGGKSALLSYIFTNAEDWYHWAVPYYELFDEAWDAVERLYETNEITRSMVNDLNPERDYDTILDECIVSGLLPSP